MLCTALLSNFSHAIICIFVHMFVCLYVYVCILQLICRWLRLRWRLKTFFSSSCTSSSMHVCIYICTYVYMFNTKLLLLLLLLRPSLSVLISTYSFSLVGFCYYLLLLLLVYIVYFLGRHSAVSQQSVWPSTVYLKRCEKYKINCFQLINTYKKSYIYNTLSC